MKKNTILTGAFLFGRCSAKRMEIWNGSQHKAKTVRRMTSIMTTCGKTDRSTKSYSNAVRGKLSGLSPITIGEI